MDEVAAATASIVQIEKDNDIVDSVTMEHSAEQILSGIKKEVEVQYLVPMMLSHNGTLVPSQHCQQSATQDPLASSKETGNFFFYDA